jgi:tRNA(fMet)-specific endonuclease VapC
MIMKVMLDTNICIFIIKKRPPEVLKHFEGYSAGEVGISSITLAELQYGVMKSIKQHSNQLALNEFAAPLDVAVFNSAAARKYGEIRSNLEKRSNPIGAFDMLIGAHALSLGVMLITNNTREFKKIEKLKLTDWTK